MRWPARSTDPDGHAYSRAGLILAALLPAALTLYLAFHSGGFFPGATSLAAVEVAIVGALWLALARRPFEGLSTPLVVVAVALGGLAAWTLLSSNWSDSAARALPEYTRALLYALTLVLFGLMPFDARRIRWMVYGLAAAAVVICATALIARLLPHVIFDPTLVHKHRLGYPLTYWNALGILSCVGVVLCVHLACSTRDSPIARVLGAAAVPLLGLTLFYTLSRGGTWAAVGALVVYVVLGRPRALLSGAVATVPATLIVLAVASPAASVTDGYPIATVSAGKHVAVVLAGCVLGAALLRASLLPLDGWLMRVRLPDRARRPVLAGAVAFALVLVLAAATAANAPEVMGTKYREFTDRSNNSPGHGESRLLNTSPNGRFDLWHVALDSYRENRFHGTGAGTYAEIWNRDRPNAAQALNAHSLYLEVLGELGLVGLVLLVIAVASILGAFACRARGPDRPLLAALLAAGLAWAIHAGVDWDWQMPAVTLWFFALGGAALAHSPGRRRRYGGEINNLIMRVGGVAACVGLAILPARVAISQAQLNSAIGAMQAGHCQQARDDAHSALSAVSQRPAPYTVIAFCDRGEGRYGPAVAAMEQALRRDPANWELHYDLAVARAGAGLDPRRAARTAAQLNPYNAIAQSAPRHFRGRNPAAWRVAARSAVVIPPAPGDP